MSQSVWVPNGKAERSTCKSYMFYRFTGLPCLLVPWHSIESSEVMERKVRFWEPLASFWTLRPDRTVMVGLTTGAAFAANAGVIDALRITLAGWCLAVGGLSLDFCADRDLDAEEPRAGMRRNPLMDACLSL